MPVNIRHTIAALFSTAACTSAAEPVVHFNHDLTYAHTPNDVHIFTGIAYYEHDDFYIMGSPEENRDGTATGPSIYCELIRQQFTGSQTAHDSYVLGNSIRFAHLNKTATFHNLNYQLLNTLKPKDTVDSTTFVDPNFMTYDYISFAGYAADDGFPYTRFYGDDFYVGVVIANGFNEHYGYIRFRVEAASFPTTQNAQDVLGVSDTRGISYLYPVEWGYETEPDTPITIPGINCPADTNHDGLVTSTDFIAWINAFNNDQPECDQNGDGVCTPTDFSAWIVNFNAGC